MDIRGGHRCAKCQFAEMHYCPRRRRPVELIEEAGTGLHQPAEDGRRHIWGKSTRNTRVCRRTPEMLIHPDRRRRLKCCAHPDIRVGQYAGPVRQATPGRTVRMKTPHMQGMAQTGESFNPLPAR